MIFCSSQFPLFCSPTCPLLLVAELPCPSFVGTGVERLPFPSFLLESRLRKNAHLLPCWESSRPGAVSRPWAGEGTGSSSLG